MGINHETYQTPSENLFRVFRVFLGSFILLVDDFGDTDLVIGGGGGIGDDLGVVKALAHFIFAEYVVDGESVSGRLNAVDIEFAELFDIVQHLIELSLEEYSFLFSQVDARKVRHITDIHSILCFRHCRFSR